MAAEPHYIDVDLKKSTHYKTTTVTQNDTDVVFILRVSDDGRSDESVLDAYTTITLTSQRRDGRSFYVLGERIPDTNEVRFKLGTKELEQPGKVTAAIQFYSVDGRISSAKFHYAVDGDVAEDYEPTETEGSLIEIVLGAGPRIMKEAEAATLAAIQAREELTGAVAGALEDLETDKAVALEEMSTATDRANTAAEGVEGKINDTEAVRASTEEVRDATQAVQDATEEVRQNTESERLATVEVRENTELVRQETDAVRQSTVRVRDESNAAGEFAQEQGEFAEQQNAEQLLQMGTVADVMEKAQGEIFPGMAEAIAESGEFLRQATSNFEKKYAKIYGVMWDKSASPTMIRMGDSIGMIAAVGVGDQLVRNDFDSAQIFRDIKTVVDKNGNRFRRIPKFYIRKKDGPLYYSEEISFVQHEGFYRAALFWDFENNVELPYYDHAIHLASESADAKLESKSGKYPLISKNIVQFRTLAQANNVDGKSGYQQLDLHAMDVLTTLFRIEFATLHSQSVMAGWSTGRYTSSDLAVAAETATNRIVVPKATAALYAVGQPISVGTSQGGNQVFYGRTITGIADYDATNSAISFDGDPVNIAVGNFLYNSGWKTGFSEQIAASSGSIGDNTSGKFPCMYRGIESPWGDVYQFVDGINISERQTWVAQNARNYASNVFAAPYEALNYVNHDVNGYITELGFDANHPYAQFPTAVGGGSTTYYGDYYYQTTGARIALVGGYWNNGSLAGLLTWYLYSSSGSATVTFGGRLLKKAS